VQLLLGAGADANKVATDGDTALSMATQAGDVERLLRAAGPR
jgi:hypothetical protein